MVVLCLCWQIQGQLRCKRVQKAQPLCRLLLIFERGTWIVPSPYFHIQNKAESTEWEIPSLTPVFSPMEIDCFVRGNS